MKKSNCLHPPSTATLSFSLILFLWLFDDLYLLCFKITHTKQVVVLSRPVMPLNYMLIAYSICTMFLNRKTLMLLVQKGYGQIHKQNVITNFAYQTHTTTEASNDHRGAGAYHLSSLCYIKIESLCTECSAYDGGSITESLATREKPFGLSLNHFPFFSTCAMPAPQKNTKDIKPTIKMGKTCTIFIKMP